MPWVGRDLKDHEAPTPCCRQGHQPPHFLPAQVAQGPIQPGLEHLQGWTGHPQPLWAAVPAPHHSLGKELAAKGSRTAIPTSSPRCQYAASVHLWHISCHCCQTQGSCTARGNTNKERKQSDAFCLIAWMSAFSLPPQEASLLAADTEH